MSKIRLATTWLDSCSGCHMSLLDIDERLLDLASQIDLVYSPLVDFKEFPDQVDVTLVEGAISSEDDLTKIRMIRERTRVLVSLGDCAVTGNVPSMRNPFSTETILERVYLNESLFRREIPTIHIPRLLERVRPVHAVVKVDVYVPGCPPSADVIYHVLAELIAGNHPVLTGKTRFGA